MKVNQSKISMWLRNLAVFILCLFGTDAFALLGDSSSPFAIDANFRTIGAGIDNVDNPAFITNHESDGLSQSILRTIISGKPNEHFFYEIHAVGNLDASTVNKKRSANASGVGFFNSGSQVTRFRALDATWNPLLENHVSSTIWFDRFNSKVSFSGIDLTIGRQAITFSKAYFWNPLDIFSPFDSNQFDRDYKAGVDAAKMDLAFNNFSGMNLVAAAGREISFLNTYVEGKEAWDVSWYGSALLARFFTTFKNWDFSLQGGKVYGGYQAGGATVGEIGPVQIRGEIATLFAQSRPPLPFPFSGKLVDDHLTGVIGAGHRFENTLDLQLEYLFNGAGDSKNFDLAFLRTSTAESLQLSEHLIGFYGTYEITPLILGKFGTLFSPVASPSVQLQPGLSISLSNESELLLGAIVNLGKRPNGRSPAGLGLRSEFGTFPDTYYAEFKFYF